MISRALKTLNSGNSVGTDCILAGALISAQEIVKILHPLVQHIWEEENIPNDWKEGYIIKIPKRRPQLV